MQTAGYPFHASHAEVDYRAESRCLEVALSVVPEELEAALERISGKRVPLEAPEAEGEIVDYLKTRFVATLPGGEPLPIEWVGREVSYREAWLYFKVTGVAGDFDLADRVLFEAEGRPAARNRRAPDAVVPRGRAGGANVHQMREG